MAEIRLVLFRLLHTLLVLIDYCFRSIVVIYLGNIVLIIGEPSTYKRMSEDVVAKAVFTNLARQVDQGAA